MPEVTYQTAIGVPIDEVWGFVQDMNHWAPMLTGYQSHEIKDERCSIWTLKGDVGILSRTVRLEVNITEWSGPNRVSFTLKGLNELVEGDGTFEMSAKPAGPATAVATSLAPPPPTASPAPGLFARFLRWIARVVFRRMHGPPPERPALDTGAPPPRGASVLSFRLRMDAGGPTAPLVNAMLEPALLPATEDLANKIAAHLERAPERRSA